MPMWSEKKKPRVNKIRKDAKFVNTPTIPIIRNLVALGFTEVDCGIVLGVEGSTIHSWKQRYPDLFKANAEGKKILKGILVAQMMRAATGYDYEEQDITYKLPKMVDVEDDEELTELVRERLMKVPDKVVVHKKHQQGNATLMTFLANNLLPVDFPRNPVSTEQNILAVIGDVEPNKIREFAGKLLSMGTERKQVESKEVVGDE